MIIPIKCFTCGKVLADKYRTYQENVRSKKLAAKVDVVKVLYLTEDNKGKTPEGETLDDMFITKMCCRRHMLTHVDII